MAAITALNPGANPNALQIGERICVPSAGTPVSCHGGTLYTIRPGDTLYVIAARYGVSLQALLTANPGIDPRSLSVGRIICIPGVEPQPPAVIPTPFCSLLQPITSALPPTADIPVGAVVARQVAMSTRAYTVVAAPLPDPAAFGNFDSYVGVLSLVTQDFTAPPRLVKVRLLSTTFGNQLPTWAGTIITAEAPVVGDFAEIRPLNSTTGAQGPALLRGNFVSCRG
ncbi:MAG: LysM peptidoglycan-binding domain-containing protein [Bacteroidota bacterium]